MKIVVRRDPVYRRRRAVAGLVALLVLSLLVLGLLRGCQALVSGDDTTSAAVRAQQSALDVSRTHLVAGRVVTGGITPKSVAASSTGLVLAQNMMYRHTVTAYGADGTQRGTVPDTVDLSAFGVQGHKGPVQGAPVEAAWLRDGSKAYVSNYSMYGPGFRDEGHDSCSSRTEVDRSYVYRVDARTLKVDQVIQVGAVPKVVAVTPDQRTLLVTNWCSGTLSIVDLAQAKEVATVEVGEHPRGIAVSPDGRTAYVAEMGGETVHAVDLQQRTAKALVRPGKGPRALVLSADGRTLYVTLNDEDRLVAVDVESGTVVRSVALPDQPRSMAASRDGRALYVVSYGAAALTKVRTPELTVQQQVATAPQPIGVAYEPTKDTVWVACYGGSLHLLPERTDGPPAPTPPAVRPSVEPSASEPAHD